MPPCVQCNSADEGRWALWCRGDEGEIAAQGEAGRFEAGRCMGDGAGPHGCRRAERTERAAFARRRAAAICMLRVLVRRIICLIDRRVVCIAMAVVTVTGQLCPNRFHVRRLAGRVFRTHAHSRSCPCLERQDQQQEQGDKIRLPGAGAERLHGLNYASEHGATGQPIPHPCSRPRRAPGWRHRCTGTRQAGLVDPA